MKTEIDKYILFNFFEGKATLMQRVLIEKWLEEEKNRELYFQWIEEWENENFQLKPDTEDAFQRSLLRIRKANEGPARNVNQKIENIRSIPQQSSVKEFSSWWIAASILLLIASFTGLWLQNDRLLQTKFETGYGEVKSFELPDGSRVVMNANSSLLFPRFGFGNKTREVVLSGEAKFSVVHTKSDQKFVVRTAGQLEVEVLGTEFVVFSRERGSKVVLNTGKIRLRAPANGVDQPLSIQPGDVVTIQPGAKLQLQHRQPLQVHQAWEDKRFIFENTSLHEITAILKENYGITLLVPDASVANRTFGGTFKVNKPESLLHSLSEMLDLQLVSLDTSTYQLMKYPQP